VLLSLIALTAIATAGYLRSNTDYRINQNHRASVKAFYVADAARSQCMGRGRVRTDTVTYNYVDGTGQVWLDTLLAVDDSSTLYRLSTVGSHSSPEGGLAARRLNSIVLHKVAGFSVNAAITSPPGLQKNGVAGDVDGHDAAPSGSCSVAGSEDVAGIALPQGTFTMAGGGKGGGGGPWPPGVTGNPAIDSTQTAMQLLLDTGIDWQGILDGSFAQADYVVSQDGYPSFAVDVASDEWPLIVADYGYYAAGPGHSGRGTLAVQGDLDINGNFDQQRRRNGTRRRDNRLEPSAWRQPRADGSGKRYLDLRLPLVQRAECARRDRLAGRRAGNLVRGHVGSQCRAVSSAVRSRGPVCGRDRPELLRYGLFRNSPDRPSRRLQTHRSSRPADLI
jgi:hypothetical protein